MGGVAGDGEAQHLLGADRAVEAVEFRCERVEEATVGDSRREVLQGGGGVAEGMDGVQCRRESQPSRSDERSECLWEKGLPSVHLCGHQLLGAVRCQ